MTQPRTQHYDLCRSPNPVLILPTICTWCELIEEVEAQMDVFNAGYAAAIADVVDLVQEHPSIQLSRSEKHVLADSIRGLAADKG